AIANPLRHLPASQDRDRFASRGFLSPPSQGKRWVLLAKNGKASRDSACTLVSELMNRRTETPEDRLQGNPAKQPLTEPAKGVYERILLGVDFSPTSTPVYEHALKLARQNHAELLLMHAYD